MPTKDDVGFDIPLLEMLAREQAEEQAASSAAENTGTCRCRIGVEGEAGGLDVGIWCGAHSQEGKDPWR